MILLLFLFAQFQAANKSYADAVVAGHEANAKAASVEISRLMREIDVK